MKTVVWCLWWLWQKLAFKRRGGSSERRCFVTDGNCEIHVFLELDPYSELKFLTFQPQLFQIWPFFLKAVFWEFPQLYGSATVNRLSTPLTLHIRCRITLWFSALFTAADSVKPFQIVSYPLSTSLPPLCLQTHMYLSHWLTPTHHYHPPIHPPTHTPHLDAHRNVRGMTQSTQCWNLVGLARSLPNSSPNEWPFRHRDKAEARFVLYGGVTGHAKHWQK